MEREGICHEGLIEGWCPIEKTHFLAMIEEKLYDYKVTEAVGEDK